MRKKVFFTTVGCLLLTFVLAGFVGCTKKETGSASAAAGADKGAALSATRTIVDHTGAEVVLPAQINRVVIVGPWPLASVYFLYTESSEKIVGMHPGAMAAAVNSYLVNVHPEVENMDSSFVQGESLNIERLLELEPDVVFYSAANTAERELFDNVGIPAVGFSTSIENFNTIRIYSRWIELLSQIFGDTGKAREIIAYGESVEKMIAERVSSIPDEDRKTAMILYYYDETGMKTRGSDSFAEYWIETTGGVNVAKDLRGTAIINMEQVYDWSPDHVFITNFSPYLPQDILQNQIDGYDWSLVEAVRNGRVHKFPLGMYRWFPPSSDTPLCLLWMAKILYPTLFEDVDMDDVTTEYYQRFYNVKLTAEDLHKIYNPPREASGR